MWTTLLRWKSITVYHFINVRDINILQIRVQLSDIFEAANTYIKAAGPMIVDFNIEIVYLVKADTKTAFVPFCQENTVCGKYLCLGHSVHKIEIPYIHKAVFCVLAPGSV
jgi:hypothetical protein